jgi:hypothetical protein
VKHLFDLLFLAGVVEELFDVAGDVGWGSKSVVGTIDEFGRVEDALGCYFRHYLVLNIDLLGQHLLFGRHASVSKGVGVKQGGWLFLELLVLFKNVFYKFFNI